MTKKMGIRWQLRLRMAEKGLFQTSDLVPLLAERGIHLSREQVYRLVAQVPQRLSTDTLAALCDILDCQPNDLLALPARDTTVLAATGTRPPARQGARSAVWPAPGCRTGMSWPRQVPPRPALYIRSKAVKSTAVASDAIPLTFSCSRWLSRSPHRHSSYQPGASSSRMSGTTARRRPGLAATR